MILAFAGIWFVRTGPDPTAPAHAAVRERISIRASGRTQSQQEPNIASHREVTKETSTSADERGSVVARATSGHAEESAEAVKDKTETKPVGRNTASSGASSSIQEVEPMRTVPHVAWLSHRVEADHVPAIIPPFHPADGTREPSTQSSSALDAVKKAFDEEAGVGELDEESPASLPRWKQAEVSAAERIRSLYGWAAYNDYQREASLRRKESAAAAEP